MCNVSNQQMVDMIYLSFIIFFTIKDMFKKSLCGKYLYPAGKELQLENSSWMLVKQSFLKFFKLVLLLLLVLSACVLPACKYVYTWCPWRSEEGFGSPDTTTVVGCESPCGC